MISATKCVYGVILRDLLDRGKLIPTFDILKTSSKLLSDDKHFKHIPK